MPITEQESTGYTERTSSSASRIFENARHSLENASTSRGPKAKFNRLTSSLDKQTCEIHPEITLEQIQNPKCPKRSNPKMWSIGSREKVKAVACIYELDDMCVHTDSELSPGILEYNTMFTFEPENHRVVRRLKRRRNSSCTINNTQINKFRQQFEHSIVKGSARLSERRMTVAALLVDMPSNMIKSRIIKSVDDDMTLMAASGTNEGKNFPLIK